jgi:hypothetical protein
MVNRTLVDDIREEVERLPVKRQRQVLAFARALSGGLPRGVPGKMLLRFAGTIDKASLDAMEKAIEEGCEQVNPDEW